MPQWAPRAVVVVHGMGMHQRGTTLHALVQGLERVGLTPDADEGGLLERVPFGAPLPPVPTRVRRGPSGTPADVYEVYWAPLTAGKTKARSVLGWLLKHTFLPGKALRRPSRKTLYDLLWLVGAVAGGLALLLVVLFSLTDLNHQAYCHLNRAPAAEKQAEKVCGDPEAASFVEEERRSDVGGGAILRGRQQLLSAARNFWQSLWTSVGNLWPRLVGSGSTGIEAGPLLPTGVWREASAVVGRMPLPFVLPLAGILWITVQMLHRLVDLGERKGVKLLWLGAQVVPAFVLVALGAPYWAALASVVALAAPLALVPSLKRRPEVAVMAVELFLLLGLIQFAPPVLVAFVWVLALAAVAFGSTRRFLAEFVGDVQVYTSLDEQSPHFAAREAVLGVAERVFQTIEARGYEKVTLVGHSLGSVVALDAIRRLDARASGVLGRIDSVITFGTALEKVKYFFSRESDPHAAEALDERRGAIARARDAGELQRSLAVAERLEALDDAVRLAGEPARAWVNLWYANDVVANPITTFTGPGRTPPQRRWGRSERLDVGTLLEESRRRQVANVGLGWRLWPPQKALWPHSDYWIDVRVLRVVAGACLPEPAALAQVEGVVGSRD